MIKTPTSGTNHILKALPPNSIILGARILTYELGRGRSFQFIAEDKCIFISVLSCIFLIWGLTMCVGLCVLALGLANVGRGHFAQLPQFQPYTHVGALGGIGKGSNASVDTAWGLRNVLALFPHFIGKEIELLIGIVSYQSHASVKHLEALRKGAMY